MASYSVFWILYQLSSYRGQKISSVRNRQEPTYHQRLFYPTISPPIPTYSMLVRPAPPPHLPVVLHFGIHVTQLPDSGMKHFGCYHVHREAVKATRRHESVLPHVTSSALDQQRHLFQSRSILSASTSTFVRVPAATACQVNLHPQ